MQRYFIPGDQWLDEQVVIRDDDYHHIANVMRMKEETSIIGCKPNGQAYLLTIDQITKGQVDCKIVKELNENNELPIHITLAQGIPKGDKLDYVVQKSTELGISTFIPLQMERTIVKWDHKKEQKKLDRLYKIAKEASEQSHRSLIPDIKPIQPVESLFKQRTFDHVLVASEFLAKGQDQQQSFKEAINQVHDGDHILLIVGPEGGFTESEIQFLEQNDARSIRLGSRILRTETAPLYALSALSFYFEEWRC
ncbi:16S rRNA (uracil(1498)-N(3))-methyltransferase [Aquisalibacillus elongatus]|uniref:Ribosomal RNA small subunit methyltransferase E n=1 Tax=Aquisalibacillus elongatus TaxID=485577 RepID=A0A3N5BD61_9BACI|nr:16S rRNA (uracil(1498)-N(3))-methyltransferase [Aquisalibacillus elongatus]RPF55584.1 16S rRNA (uracil1498-N3)-methyltransferase [Aquisalibacillus elongatus]